MKQTREERRKKWFKKIEKEVEKYLEEQKQRDKEYVMDVDKIDWEGEKVLDKKESKAKKKAYNQSPKRKAYEKAYGKEYKWKRKFGLTPEDYNKMLLKQNGVCAICGNKETIKRNGKIQDLAVDHCHETGENRGLLCQSCNLGIGKLKHDLFILEKAMEYLK